MGRRNTHGAAVRRIPEGLWALVAAALLIVLMRAFVVRPFSVFSGSMRPTLEEGDSVLVNEIVYRLHPPRRGDVILFRYPRDKGWGFVKRVVGVPGDTVAARDGRLWVNGLPLAEPYVVPASESDAAVLNLGARRIPPGQLFVLGDNRGASLDSRFWGTVDERDVIGKAFLIYWSGRSHLWGVRWERVGQWLR